MPYYRGRGRLYYCQSLYVSRCAYGAQRAGSKFGLPAPAPHPPTRPPLFSPLPLNFQNAEHVRCQNAEHERSPPAVPCPFPLSPLNRPHKQTVPISRCKGFFKRTVQNKRVYTCVGGSSSCPIDKEKRNRSAPLLLSVILPISGANLADSRSVSKKEWSLKVCPENRRQGRLFLGDGQRLAVDCCHSPCLPQPAHSSSNLPFLVSPFIIITSSQPPERGFQVSIISYPLPSQLVLMLFVSIDAISRILLPFPCTYC